MSFMLTLYPYQIPHARFVLESIRKHGAFLDRSKTGAGKTYIAVWIARMLGYTPVVLTTKSTIGAWKEAFAVAEIPDGHVTNYDKAIRGWVEVDFNWMRELSRQGKVRFNFTWTTAGSPLFIFDEVHRCKGEESISAQLLLSAAATHYPILMLSATAIESPEDMYALGVTLGLFHPRKFFAWKLRHGIRKLWHGHFGLDPKMREWAIERIKTALEGKTAGIDTNTVPGFPETNISTVLVDIPETLTREAADKVEELLTLCDNAEDAMVRTLRLRQSVELAKAEGMAVRAMDHYNDGRTVLVFLTFRDSISAFVAALKKETKERIGVLTGDTPQGERELLIRDVQTDKLRFLVLQIAAGGTGVSLHDVTGVYPRASLISPDFVARNLIQVLGRAHRAGGKSRSVQEIIFANYSIDLAVRNNLAPKLKSIDTISDDDFFSAIPVKDETRKA